jgi:cytochrome c
MDGNPSDGDALEPARKTMVKAEPLVITVALIAALPGVALAQDATAGAEVFERCAICHQVGETAQTSVGPVLNGIVGRRAGRDPGYVYSDAALGSGLIWDEATLTEYLKNPRVKVPGTKMLFPGLQDDQDISNVIAYLKRFGPDGRPAAPAQTASTSSPTSAPALATEQPPSAPSAAPPPPPAPPPPSSETSAAALATDQPPSAPSAAPPPPPASPPPSSETSAAALATDQPPSAPVAALPLRPAPAPSSKTSPAALATGQPPSAPSAAPPPPPARPPPSSETSAAALATDQPPSAPSAATTPPPAPPRPSSETSAAARATDQPPSAPSAAPPPPPALPPPSSETSAAALATDQPPSAPVAALPPRPAPAPWSKTSPAALATGQPPLAPSAAPPPPAQSLVQTSGASAGAAVFKKGVDALRHRDREGVERAFDEAGRDACDYFDLAAKLFDPNASSIKREFSPDGLKALQYYLKARVDPSCRDEAERRIRDLLEWARGSDPRTVLHWWDEHH